MTHSRFQFKLLAYAGILSMLFIYSWLCASTFRFFLGRPLRDAGELGFLLAMLSLFASLVPFGLTLILFRSIARSYRSEPEYVPEPTRATWGNLEPNLLNQEKSATRRRKRLAATLKLQQWREAHIRG